MEKIEQYGKSVGFSDVANLFLNHADPESGAPKELTYPASLYELRKAICALDDHFTYGQSKLVYDENYSGTIIYPELYKKIMAHPEDFGVIDLVYD